MGFAGGTADATCLSDLKRSYKSIAGTCSIRRRTCQGLAHGPAFTPFEAMPVADRHHSLIVTGNGDVNRSKAARD